jgi:hypothetical protein
VNVFSLPANYYRILIQEFRAGRLDIIGCDAPAWFELGGTMPNYQESAFHDEKPISEYVQTLADGTSFRSDKGYIH